MVGKKAKTPKVVVSGWVVLGVGCEFEKQCAVPEVRSTAER